MDEASSEKLSLAIGNVCVAWSLIEAHVGILIAHQIRAALRDQVNGMAATIFETMIQNMELRQRTQTAKAIAVGFSENVFPKVETLMNRIDNELRTERNRYVHDLWLQEGEGLVRIKPGTFIQYEQARRPVANLERRTLFSGVDEVETFAKTLNQVLGELMELTSEFRALTEKRRDEAPRPQAGAG